MQKHKQRAVQLRAVQGSKTVTQKAAYIQDNRRPNPVQKKMAGEKGKMQKEAPVQSKANTTGLPDALKTGIEDLSGISMNDVQVKYNSSKPAQLQAHAYAQGNEIHIGPGQEKHLPHEAWHVVQQKQGRVQPTVQAKGNIKINDDKALENEADTMGRKAIQKKAIPGSLTTKTASGSGIVQMTKWRWDENRNNGNGGWKMISGGVKGEAPPDFDGEYHGEEYDDEPKSRKRKKDDDETYKGARTFGNSTRLAKNKYNQSSKKPHVNYKTWRTDKEAQHIVPASLAKRHKPLQNIIDNVENAIMLPAQLDNQNAKVTHRKPNYRDHPNYSNNVALLIKTVLKKTGLGSNQKTMIMVMTALRPVNKLAAKYDYLDDIPYSKFKKAWNNEYGNQYPI